MKAAEGVGTEQGIVYVWCHLSASSLDREEKLSDDCIFSELFYNFGNSIQGTPGFTGIFPQAVLLISWQKSSINPVLDYHHQIL